MFYLITNNEAVLLFCLLTKRCHYVVNDHSDDIPIRYGDGRKLFMRNSVNHLIIKLPQNIESDFDKRIVLDLTKRL